MTQLTGLVDVMKNNAIFYMDKPEFKDLFTHLCQICELYEKEKQENNEAVTWRKKL